MKSIPVTEEEIRAELVRELLCAQAVGRKSLAALLEQHVNLTHFTEGQMAVLAVFAALREDGVL